MPGPLRSLLHGFSQIFLQAHAGCGLLVLLAVAFGAPALLPGMLLGVGGATLWAGLRGYPPGDVALGLYGYNAALLGALATLCWGLTPTGLAVTLLCAVLSCPLQAGLLLAMRRRGWPPGFTLPFVLLGWGLIALSTAPSAGPVDAVAATWPAWLQAGLRGIGQVVFLDHAASGACLLLGVLLAERRAGLWLALGALIGTFAALGLGLAGAANGLHGFNPALASLASSQVQRGAAPLAAALLAALLSLAAHRYGWPVLTLPFILACWGLRALAPVRPAQPQVSRGS